MSVLLHRAWAVVSNPLSFVSLIIPYGKPCGSKIESTKRTVIMPKNVRVLAINVRVFYKRTCFIYTATSSCNIRCFIINVRVSL